MAIRGTIARNFANSFGSFVDGTVEAVYTARSLEDSNSKAAKTKTENENRLFTSNQYKLTQKYKTDVADKVGSLPQSVDFSGYGEQMEEWNQQWLSDVKSSGIYDDRTLSWLESDFMPSQKASNEQVVAGVQNYAMNAWVANDAGSFANVLQADEGLSVDDAYEAYNAYYERLGLGNVSQDYGILSPETFREEIRGAKAQQAFRAMCDEGFGYDPQWNYEEAVRKAMDETGYKPDSVQSIQFRQACRSIVDSRKSEIQTAVSDEAVSLSTELNSFMTQGLYYDTKNLMDAAAAYPISYAGPILQLVDSAEQSNDTIIYNDIVRGDLPLDDDSLASFSSGSQYRQRLVESDLTSKAQTMFNAGSSLTDVVSWLNNGDLGYTVDSDTRESVASSIVSWAKDQKGLIEDIDDIELFHVENQGLKGNPAVVSWVDSSILQPIVHEDSNGNVGEEVAGDGHQDVAETSVSSDAETSASSYSEEDSESMADSYVPATIAPASGGYGQSSTSTMSFLTDSAANAAQSSLVEQNSTSSASDVYVEQQLYRMKYVDCLPDEVVKAKVSQAYRSGAISREKAEELSKTFPLAGSEQWTNLVSTVGALVDKYIPSKGNDFYATDRMNAKSAVVQALVQNVSSNPALLDDPAAMQSAINKISNDKIAAEWFKKAKSYADASEGAEGYIKALSKAKHSDLLEALQDGGLQVFIDYGAQLSYAQGDPHFEGGVDEMRNWFTKQLGFGNSYSELEDADKKSADLQKLIVEYNVAYAQFRGDARQLFQYTFGDYMDVSKSDIQWVETAIGGSFAFRDPENEGLYYIPDLTTIEKEGGRLKCTWFYMYDTNGDGSPDGDMAKFSNMTRLMTDLEGYKREIESNNSRIDAIQKAAGSRAETLEILDKANPENEGLNRMAVDNSGLDLGEALSGIVRGLAGLFRKSDKHKDEDQAVRYTMDMLRNGGGPRGAEYKAMR